MLSCELNGNMIHTFDYERDTLKRWADKDILLCPVCQKPYEYTEYCYSSPKRRRSNKYPYPVAKHYYASNVALAKVQTLAGVSIESILLNIPDETSI